MYIHVHLARNITRRHGILWVGKTAFVIQIEQRIPCINRDFSLAQPNDFRFIDYIISASMFREVSL